MGHQNKSNPNRGCFCFSEAASTLSILIFDIVSLLNRRARLFFLMRSSEIGHCKKGGEVTSGPGSFI